MDESLETAFWRLPVLPLRDIVVYPHMVIPLFVGRQPSINAIEAAAGQDKQIFLLAQRSPVDEKPALNQMYEIGTVATILQVLKLPDGSVKVLVEGTKRGRIRQFLQQEEFFLATIEKLQEAEADREAVEVSMRTILAQFEKYVQLNKKIPPEVVGSLTSISDPGRLADTIIAHMPLKVAQKQEVLELLDVPKRLERVMLLIAGESELQRLEKKVEGRVKKQMEKKHREFYLHEKMQAIQKELGEVSGDGRSVSEPENLEKQIKAAGMSEEAQAKCLEELNKLKMMAPMSAEATVSRSYIDWMLKTPWKKRSKVINDLNKAQEILDEDHYGLEKVKERITEYLAVQQRIKKVKGPILCLVGPPGVGKTSLGHSIARSTGRKFVRMSLGGVRDEAEIRGHRRTYIGSMPGKIIQKLGKIGTRNPLFLLDEVDKIGMDFRGDPASALLEVLDPEQNNTFNDHYLEVDYDLSDVMFIATANTMNIPAALLDRMEVIRLPGYTEDEKLNIAMRYLVPKQIKENGLKSTEIDIARTAIIDIIRYYTREAGVRNLEREISKICRKVVKRVQTVEKDKAKGRTAITQRSLEKYLGVKRFRYGVAEEHNQIGQVFGLAWTEVGGELLTIEAAVVPGKGKTEYTGHLGEVMQESIKAALTVVRSRAGGLGIQPNFYESHDIHVHVPEGATPKDGPSAGVGMCAALVSAITQIPVKASVAMTGEITLRGEVLPIGGLKEKLLAALRGRIQTVIIPKENERDLKEIPKKITNTLDIKPVRWIDEVLGLALAEVPKPLRGHPGKDMGVESHLFTSQGRRSRKKGGRPQAH